MAQDELRNKSTGIIHNELCSVKTSGSYKLLLQEKFESID